MNWLIYDFNIRENLLGIQDVDTPGDNHCCVQSCWGCHARAARDRPGAGDWAPSQTACACKPPGGGGGMECPTLWPHGCSPPGSSVHGILQARLEWVVIPFSRGSSWPRDRTWVFCTAGRFFTSWATREAPHQKARVNKNILIVVTKKGSFLITTELHYL